MSLLSDAISKVNNDEYLSSLEYHEILKWGRISGGTGKQACDAIATALANGGKPFRLVNRNHYEEERLAKLGTPQSTGGCFLTSACMQRLKEDFDDDCEELSILREFRDTFVQQHYPESVNYYYEVAPKIVKAMEERADSTKLFDDLYENLVAPCVQAVRQGNYLSAYSHYRSYTLALEKVYI